MPANYVDVGSERIFFGTYNPSSPLSRLYCHFVLDKIASALQNVTRDEAHAWIRAHFPQAAELLEHVEAGGTIPTELRPGEYPVTPGLAELEVPIIAALRTG
jgi:hypothetical protein